MELSATLVLLFDLWLLFYTRSCKKSNTESGILSFWSTSSYNESPLYLCEGIYKHNYAFLNDNSINAVLLNMKLKTTSDELP